MNSNSFLSLDLCVSRGLNGGREWCFLSGIVGLFAAFYRNNYFSFSEERFMAVVN